MVRRKGLIACACVAVAACAPQPPVGRRPIEPHVAATVLTIETRTQPQNKTLRHSIIIANGRARSDDEVDRWRLFDLANRRVTYVDDIRRTYETRPVSEVAGERLEAANETLAAGLPRAEVVATGVKRVIDGIETSQILIRLGGYQRELWIGNPQSIPSNLFAVWFSTLPVDSKYEPIMRDADEALANLQGFPLADHAELSYGTSKLVIDRSVVRIERRIVPRALLSVNPAYRQLIAPAASLPPAS